MSVTLPSGAGKSTIIQVVSRTQMIPFGSANYAYTNTNLAVAITPLSTASTFSILVAACAGTGTGSNDAFWRVLESTTVGDFVLNPNDGASHPDSGPYPYTWQTAGQSPFATYHLGGNLSSYVRSGTLSPITYILQVSTSALALLGVRGYAEDFPVPSTLTILEISND